jgi:hypothetical protein
VFTGFEFVHTRPVIITGDTIQPTRKPFKEGEIRINIFNISKFNLIKDKKKGGIRALTPNQKTIRIFIGRTWLGISFREFKI